MLLKNNLTGFQHLGIPVADIQAAKQWYCEVLDFEIVYEPRIETPDGVIELAFLQRTDIVLELYQLLGDDLEEVRGRSHGHIDHFAIDVLDIRAAIGETQSRGGILSPETLEGPIAIPQFWSKGVEYVFLVAAGREKVELNQRIDLDTSRREANLNGWSHLGIPVTNLSRSEAFYRQFGFEVVMQASIPVDDQEIKCAMLSYGSFTLELYQLLPEMLAEIRARGDGYIDHFALDVKDIGRAYQELQAAGLNPLETEPVELPIWENGVKYFFVRGPDG
jgi:lactoylglutathione lyase